MTSIAAVRPLSATGLSRSRRAAAALFLLNGALLASWATEVPRIKESLGLNELQLGLALLAFTGGSALILPFIGQALTRLGLRSVSAVAALLAATGLAASALATGPWTLSLALLVFGAGFGALDVALNSAGVVLERQAGRPLMSGLHAMYSLGALAGAVGGGGLIWARMGAAAHLAALLVLAAGATYVFAARLPGESVAPEPGSSEAAPGRGAWSLPLVALGLLAACAAIPEGAVTDWAGLYLRETVLAPEGAEALGFAGFALTMLVGRLFGDRLSEAWGPARLGQAGSVLAVVGLALALGMPTLVAAVLGFALLGLGLSVLAPLAFSAVGRVAQDTAPAVAKVTAFFYIGYLAGPPVIGFLAHHSSLRAALAHLVLTSAVAIVLSGVLREEPRRGIGSG
jgi:MFS family permease